MVFADKHRADPFGFQPVQQSGHPQQSLSWCVSSKKLSGNSRRLANIKPSSCPEAAPGKSYASKLLLRQLFDVADGGPEADAFKHLAAAFTVLHSLGSAKTQANSESSRIVCPVHPAIGPTNNNNVFL